RINLGKAGMAEFFNRIDVLCIPSVGFETGPYVLYEALMAGKPVIASDLSSMSTWAAKGFPVSVFENANADDLVRALRNWKPVPKYLHLPVPDAEQITREILAYYQSAQ
ncbi:MAG: glycosyltransferase, partial [Mucilaginibacter polytrichastri]|nr:glycosyltransferase [Mucilaginibacter polytrichastri]